MPPRRMGSISVVVVFSSRLNFSGGPEPPSPATRLLPGPDMAVAARGRAGSPQGTSGRSRQYFRHLQKTERIHVDATSNLQPQPSPAHIYTCCIPPLSILCPSPAGAESAHGRHLEPHRTSPAFPAQSAGARGSAGYGGTAFPVSIGRARSHISGPLTFFS